MEPTGGFKTGGGDVLCVQFRPDDGKIFLACADGGIRIHNAESPFEHVGTLKDTAAGGTTERPTLLRFLDATTHAGELLACCISGAVLLWHAPSQKVLGRFQGKGCLQALDIRPDGRQFATAGETCTVQVFDLGDRAAETTVLGGYKATSELLHAPESHGNRIHVVRYHPTDHHLLYSAGWDGQVLQWDVTRREVARFFSGPYVCGEGLDVHPGGELLLTASFREGADCVELWNVPKRERVRVVAPTDGGCAYSCRFHPTAPQYACVAGTKQYQLRMVDVTTGETVGRAEAKSGMYSCAFDAKGSRVVAAGVGGAVVVASVADTLRRLHPLPPVKNVAEDPHEVAERNAEHEIAVQKILKEQRKHHDKLDLDVPDEEVGDDGDDDDDDGDD